VNKGVAITMKVASGRKRKPYKKISDSLRAKIGRRFLKEFNTCLSESIWYNHCRGKAMYISAQDAKKLIPHLSPHDTYC